jgi:glycosyltransferase involved in cell wall biosynthesis
MKLVIQIPAWNERENLPLALAALPRRVPGFDEVEVLVVDDGSTDGTAEAARAGGADRVVTLPFHRGLASTFNAALAESLRMGADVVVNTDADNQYDASAIPELVRPILEGRAAMVVGNRRVETIGHFSPTKIFLQKLGSAVVSYASGLRVPDATSGFRAFSREAALRLNVFSRMTYTLETLIQAGELDLPVESVPVATNPKLRESRLIRSNARYVAVSAANILRLTVLYRPLKLFLTLASLLAVPGVILVVRWFWYFFTTLGQAPTGRTQSLTMGISLLLASGGAVALGLVADLVSINRRLLEEILLRERKRDRKE